VTLFPRRLRPQSAIACVLCLIASFPAFAQTQTNPSLASSQNQAVLDTLPDAPEVASAQTAEPAPPTDALRPNGPGSVTSPDPVQSPLPEASRTQRYPRPGQPAPVLTAHDKFVMGLQGAFSLYAAVGWLSAAGYEQATGTPPYYGSDRGAFGQRLGAAAIRAISEDTLADSVLAPAFHEDPRYYRLGHRHKILARIAYAASRAVITRNDQGRTVPNFSQITANLVGAALTNAYYPQANRSATQTIETFGGSLGGTALGNGIAEFFAPILFDHHFHHSN
jgi:hypothetical protein